MADELRFKPLDTESDSPILVSEPFLLSQEQIAEVVAEFEHASEEDQEHLDDGEQFEIGGQTLLIEFDPEMTAEGQQWWSVTIKKLPDHPVALPERLCEILAGKDSLQDFSHPEEQWPFPSVE